MNETNYKGNRTPCQNNCGYIFCEDRKYIIIKDGTAIFVCKDCYNKMK